METQATLRPSGSSSFPAVQPQEGREPKGLMICRRPCGFQHSTTMDEHKDYTPPMVPAGLVLSALSTGQQSRHSLAICRETQVPTQFSAQFAVGDPFVGGAPGSLPSASLSRQRERLI